MDGLHRVVLFALCALLSVTANAFTCTSPLMPYATGAALDSARAAIQVSLGQCQSGVTPAAPGAGGYSSCYAEEETYAPGADFCGTAVDGPGTCLRVRVNNNGGGIGTYTQGFVQMVCLSSPPPPPVTPHSCPSVDSLTAAVYTRVIDNLSEAGAVAVARDSARNVAGSCVDNCVVTHKNAVCGGSAGKWTCELSGGAASGNSCTGSGSGVVTSEGFQPTVYDSAAGVTATNTTTSAPPGGKCAGTFNGVTVYHDCASTTTGTTTSSTSGSGTGTATTTKETITTCSGGTCTSIVTSTTTTAINSGTSTITSTTPNGTKTVQDDLSSFCKTNPDSAVCKGSRFGGSCNAAFNCEGDAAMCAIAQATNRTNCAFSPDTVADQALAAAIAASGSGGSGSNTFTLSSASINTTDALTGAACIGDVSITVWGKAVTLPVSDICPTLQIMGNILVAVAMLVAIKIIGS